MCTYPPGAAVIAHCHAPHRTHGSSRLVYIHSLVSSSGGATTAVYVLYSEAKGVDAHATHLSAFFNIHMVSEAFTTARAVQRLRSIVKCCLEKLLNLSTCTHT